MNNLSKELTISFSLLLPVILFYVAHYSPPNNLIGTGFVQGDMLSYMSNAREYFDESNFHFLYSNPFNLDNSGSNIYFQFQTLLLGLVFYITNGDIGIIFLAFGIISSFLSIWVALRLFKSFIGWGTLAHLATFILFIYGGGVLIISGFIYSFLNEPTILLAIQNSLIFDPGGGFWMLNFGRNFVYPTEAYYHLITIGILLSIINNHQKATNLLLLLLAFSHPFYGLQFLIIIITWQIIERIIYKNVSIRKSNIGLNLIILIAFTLYYGVFLRSFDEHTIIIEQWSINWFLSVPNILFAYSPLIIFFTYKLRTKKLFKKFFESPFHRMLLIYTTVSFVLANHELFMKPIQPIHFAHGHIYIPLFLLSASSIVRFFQMQKHKIVSIFVFLILISDNASWYPAQAYKSISNKISSTGILISKSQKEILNYMNKNYDSNCLLISENNELDYYATGYTKLYSLIPHSFNTPFVTKRIQLYKDFYNRKEYNILPSHIIVVIDNIYYEGINQDFKTSPIFVEVYKNDQYILYERNLKTQ